MNKIKIFENPEFGSIRTVDRNGEPWFVGKDVADSDKSEGGKSMDKKRMQYDPQNAIQTIQGTVFGLRYRVRIV